MKFDWPSIRVLGIPDFFRVEIADEHALVLRDKKTGRLWRLEKSSPNEFELHVQGQFVMRSQLPRLLALLGFIRPVKLPDSSQN